MSVNKNSSFIKGTFEYDYNFLKKYYSDIVVLKDNDASVIVLPELQGRVMTSTSNGLLGKSYGWINHDLISSGEKMERMHAMGGEERFWLGPEGGQYTIFFTPGKTFDFENWYVPKELDTEPFSLTKFDEKEAYFEKDMELVNHSGNTLNLKVDRKVTLLNREDAKLALGVEISDRLSMVGYETDNKISNTGKNDWTEESGKLSIWLLGMYNPSDEAIIIIPFKKGDVTELGKVVTDDYFGKIDEDRLTIKDGIILFKADGHNRGKIGISPQRALPYAGSYDPINKILTITHFSLPKDENDYVNSMWEMQENPYKGDAVNAYNDGKQDDGSQLGPFYELESSSPALGLKSGESATHVNQTYHFEGDEEVLNKIVKKVFKISIHELKLK